MAAAHQRQRFIELFRAAQHPAIAIDLKQLIFGQIDFDLADEALVENGDPNLAASSAASGASASTITTPVAFFPTGRSGSRNEIQKTVTLPSQFCRGPKVMAGTCPAMTALSD